MTTYDFAFVLDADPHDEAVEDMFLCEPFDDATLILQNGALAISFDRTEKTYKDAVLSAYTDIKAAGVGIISFDPDYLVTATEIAKRVQLSKAVISKYTHPALENGFPAPVRGVLSNRPVYDWVPVSRWFMEQEKIDVSEYRHAVVSRVMNIGAQAESAMGIPLDLPAMVDRGLEAV